MRRSNSRPGIPETVGGEEIEWELRPGGMLVQKREDGDGPAGPMIKIKVSHGTYQHEVTVPAQSTFGELKKVLAQETGLEPQEQRLLFRGKEKDDDDYLHMVGIKDMSKVILMEDPASKERKLEEMKGNHGISKACEAVSCVRVEVDKLAGKVSALESTVNRGTKVTEKEFVVLTELLMMQLLKLDSIEAEGEAKVQRRTEVRRVQNLVDTLDTLKARNANPFNSSGKSASVTTQWETFDTGVGSLTAPPPRAAANTKTTQDWERFD
uniref:BAG family molecular chaperone regulator 4 n=1 Tax=Anthurium amnicola TaxID=1678845 RepID=A0A1D1YKB7_9ARAE